MPVDDRSSDAMIDEALIETFPASDPPANTVETGIRIGELPSPSDTGVTDNVGLNRFELTVDGKTAYLTYERSVDRIALVHTEVPVELRGRHLGERLVEGALTTSREHGLRIVLVCPFARAYVRKHRPELSAVDAWRDQDG
jgi:uncharacterized protein